MIRATCLGHAALLIETECTRVLMDPILGAAVSGGGNIIDPPREIDLTALRNLDLIVISHHHSDHYNLADLDLIPDGAKQHFIIPNDSRMESQLRSWGARKVTLLAPWQAFQIGDLSLTATSSDVPFAEMGILFQQGKTRLLNLVDTVFHSRVPELLSVVGLAPDVVLAPFQAGGYMSFLPLREGAMPRGLDQAIDRWSSAYLTELVGDLATFQPKLVVSFADGLAYKDQGINARHFPLPDSAFIERIEAAGYNACKATPGLVIEASGDAPAVTQTPNGLVRVAFDRACSRKFDLTVPLKDRPLSWYDLRFGGLHQERNANWNQVLRDHLANRLARMPTHLQPNMQQKLNAWHLHLLDATGDSVLYCEWSEDKNPTLGESASVPSDRPYGVLCHGRDLAEVAAKLLNFEAITLGGLFRYRSPEFSDNLEDLRGYVLQPLHWLFDE